MNALLLAAMPLALIDGAAAPPAQWEAMAPAVQAALECREALPPQLLRDLPSAAPGRWVLTPAPGFTAMGLPIAQVEVSLPPDRPQGARYRATVARGSLEQVQLLLTMAARYQPIGRLSAEPGPAPGQVTFACTLAGKA